MSSSFDVLLKEFAASKGMDMDSAAYGLEFECEDTQVFVVSHPLHEDRLLCEVGVASFDELPPASVSSLLLQINEAARFEHDWSIVMDGDWEVGLTTSAALQGLTVAELEALMLDGVERAQVLKGMLQEVIAASSQESTQTSATGAPALGLDPSMMMRG